MPNNDASPETRELGNSLLQMESTIGQDKVSLFAMVDDSVLEMESEDLSPEVMENYGCTVCHKDGMDGDELKAHAICHVEYNLLKQETNSIEVDSSSNSCIDDRTELMHTTIEHSIASESTSNSWLDIFDSCPTPRRYFKIGKPKKTYGNPKTKEDALTNHHFNGTTVQDIIYSPQSSFHDTNSTTVELSAYPPGPESYNVMIDLPPSSSEHVDDMTCTPPITPTSSLGQPFAIASLFLVESIDSEYNKSSNPSFDPLGSEIETPTSRHVPPVKSSLCRMKASRKASRKKNVTPLSKVCQLLGMKDRPHHFKTSPRKQPLTTTEKSLQVEPPLTKQLPTIGNKSLPCSPDDTVLQSDALFPEYVLLNDTQQLKLPGALTDKSLQRNETESESLASEASKLPLGNDLQTETLVVQGSILDGELQEFVESSSKSLTRRRNHSPNIMPFLCGICGKAYVKKHNLKCHIDNIHALDPVACNVCNKTYRNDMMLKTHMMCHTREFPYKCLTCDEGFLFFSALKRHKFKEHKIVEKPFKCDMCKNAYTSNQFLENHLKAEHSGEKRNHLCPKCGKVFLKRQGLASHMIYHTPKKHLCHSCGAKYHYSAELKNHMQSHHGNKDIPCVSCGALFYSQLRLKRHVLMYHTENLPRKCSHCDKGFRYPKGLKHHEILIHGINTDGTPVYTCEICNQSFLDLKKMTDHKNVHTGNRPYPCRECGSKFRNRHTLQQHKRTHLDIPKASSNIKCNLCDKKFKTVETLYHHKKRHETAQKMCKFVCNICDKACSTRSNLNRHKTDVHLEGEEADLESQKTQSLNHQDKETRQSIDKNPLVCSECNQRHPSLRLLNLHKKQVHHIEYPFPCDRCDKAYGTHGGLYQHVQRFHEKRRPKPLPCPDCGIVLSSATVLKYHQMVRHNTSTEEHPCETCGKCFKYKPHLVKHKLTHLDKKDRKSYKCELCSKVMISQWAKHVHMLIHKGIKRHKCGVCGRAFTQSGDRNKHQNKCKK